MFFSVEYVKKKYIYIESSYVEEFYVSFMGNLLFLLLENKKFEKEENNKYIINVI